MKNKSEINDSIKIATYAIIVWSAYSFIYTLFVGVNERISASAVSFSMIEGVIFVGSSIAVLNKKFAFLWIILIALILDTFFLFFSPYFSALPLILRLGLIILTIIGIKNIDTTIVGERKENYSNKERDSEKTKKENNNQSKTKFDFDNNEDFYVAILNLPKDFSINDIKKSYKQEIIKYHPDKVEHLGDEFKTMAEQKTKEINEALEYFKQKLNFA